MGGVNDEGLVGWVPGGGGLKTTNVGAVSQLGLGVATNVLVVLCGLKEELVLFGSSLVSESSLDKLVNALPIPVPLLGKTYQEHRCVKSVWTGLGDQAIGDSVVVDAPVVLNLQLSQLLRSGESNRELLDSAHEGILRLVEHLLRLEDGQDLGLILQSLLAEHEVGQLVNVDVTLRTLRCEELTALRPGGRQLRDPVWRRSNHFERVVLEMKMGYIG